MVRSYSIIKTNIGKTGSNLKSKIQNFKQASSLNTELLKIFKFDYCNLI